MNSTGAIARVAAMNLTVRVQPLLAGLVLVLVGAGKTDAPEKNDMGTPADKPAGGLQADPRFYKLNSVMGVVTSGGKPVPGATVTIVKTSESFPVEATGSYVIVLDPERLGGRRHELAYAAPGCIEQRHFVYVPENNQTRHDVELLPAK
jgi:hypothetical protein